MRAMRRLFVHEFSLGISMLRWMFRRPHGVRPGDLAVPYAAGQAAAMYAFLFVSIVETVVLDLLIPWEGLRKVVLLLDLWGVYFVLALHASCVVRPHVVGPDGSLRLRRGGLLDIRIPADRIASVRLDRRYAGGKKGAVGEDGAVSLPVAGETTITVETTAPIRFLRVLGKPDQAAAFRFSADDPKAAVAALRARTAGARPEGSSKLP